MHGHLAGNEFFGIEVGDEALYSLYMICGFDSCMIIREAGNI
jgi:hypothetical protein